MRRAYCIFCECGRRFLIKSAKEISGLQRTVEKCRLAGSTFMYDSCSNEMSQVVGLKVEHITEHATLLTVCHTSLCRWKYRFSPVLRRSVKLRQNVSRKNC